MPNFESQSTNLNLALALIVAKVCNIASDE
jgi:hypothetical protein